MRRAPVLLSLLAVGVFATGCGDSSSTAPGNAATSASSLTSRQSEVPPPSAVGQPTETAVVGTVTIVDGKPDGGVQRISTSADQPAVLQVTSDKATEVHVHGADRTIEVPANVQTSVDVSQSAPGNYEVEDHSSDELLAQLRVS